MTCKAFRREVLETCGASGTEADELLAYNQSAFNLSAPLQRLDDEPFVEAWAGYAEEAEQVGAWACLRQKLVQFQFPIREGISKTEAYRRATRRGELPGGETGSGGLTLEAPDRLRIQMHKTPAGRIPLLITERRADFETLVRALLRRGEPAAVPASMGACMVAGYNNWDRIRAYRAGWERRTGASSEAAWARAFKRLIPQKERYQDRFILLSDGPYSGVPAAAFGLSEATWRQLSLTIRREHECAHYATRRAFSSMRNNALDELIADFMGLTAATGAFRADWFLHFMGLEAYPAYRSGGRLENYRGDPPLSQGAFRVLQALVVRAARHLEAFSGAHAARLQNKRVALAVLTQFTLEALASSKAASLLRRALEGATASAGSRAIEVA